jgi:hypothetical protein
MSGLDWGGRHGTRDVRGTGARRRCSSTIRPMAGRAWGAILPLATLGACTTIELDPNGSRRVTAVGIVQVRMPSSTGDLTVIERTGVGLGLDRLPGGGAWLGYSDAGWILADPAQCQMIVVIRSSAQARSALQILSQVGETACVVDQTES